MANQYFSYLPDFEYVSRLSGSNISDYVRVKNLFKRTKVNDTIFGDLTNFTKYKIIGNERPDQVAFKIYGDSNLDWLVMLTNNILTYQDEWPLQDNAFYNYLLAKYGTEEKLLEVHHYETQEVKSSFGVTIVPKGLEVPSNYSVTFYDDGAMKTESLVDTITNYEYEQKIQDDRRNIFLLKTQYLGLALETMEEVLINESGSSQYVSDELSKGENIRLYQ
tara:strand:+ start:161 stop:820 length:660 start_codon:yes stop_codon:yes gene_type:complete